MSQCSGSTGVASGSPAYFQFDSTTVGSFLPFGAAVAWLGFLDLPVGPVDTAQFCSVEPPDTTLLATDILSFAIPPLAKLNGAYYRLANYIQQQAFSQYCACTSTGGTSTYAAQILGLAPYWYYKAGELSGTALVDSSGNGRNGGYWTAAGQGAAALMSGDTSKSYATGTGWLQTPVLALPVDGFDGSADASMEFWAAFTSPAATACLYDTYNGTNPFFRLEVDNGGHVRIRCRDSAGAQTATSYTATSVDAGTVHQYDVVWDHLAHTATLYIDAVSALTATGLSTNSYTPAGGNHFLARDNSLAVTLTGRVGHWSWFAGRKLTAVQISDNKAAAGGLTIYSPPTVPTVADGLPPTPTPPACGTTQDICNQLASLSYTVSGISTTLNAYLARIHPFFIVPSTVHTGLSGAGSIAVSDILGVVVSMTTVPPGWGETGESPPRLIPSIGSIQWISGPNYLDNLQVHYQREQFLLQASFADHVRYNFRPGAVATITELVAGS